MLMENISLTSLMKWIDTSLLITYTLIGEDVSLQGVIILVIFLCIILRERHVMNIQTNSVVQADKGWRIWWQLSRPHTLTAAFIPVLLGTALAINNGPI